MRGEKLIFFKSSVLSVLDHISTLPWEGRNRNCPMLPYYSPKEEVLGLSTQALIFSKVPDRIGGGKVSTAVNSGTTFGLYFRHLGTPCPSPRLRFPLSMLGKIGRGCHQGAVKPLIALTCGGCLSNHGDGCAT